LGKPTKTYVKKRDSKRGKKAESVIGPDVRERETEEKTRTLRKRSIEKRGQPGD